MFRFEGVPEYDPFPCTSCGICCTKVEHLDLPQTDGICDHFDRQARLCTIYEDRPPICRVDDSIAMMFKIQEVGQKLTADVCNMWIKEEGMDDSYLVKIGDNNAE